MIKILELSTREPLSPARSQWRIQDRVIQFWLIVDEFIHNIRRGLLVSPLEIGHKTIPICSNQHKKKAQKAPSLNTLRISIVEWKRQRPRLGKGIFIFLRLRFTNDENKWSEFSECILMSKLENSSPRISLSPSMGITRQHGSLLTTASVPAATVCRRPNFSARGIALLRFITTQC